MSRINYNNNLRPQKSEVTDLEGLQATYKNATKEEQKAGYESIKNALINLSKYPKIPTGDTKLVDVHIDPSPPISVALTAIFG